MKLGRRLVRLTEWLPTFHRPAQRNHHRSIAAIYMALEKVETMQTANCLAFDGWMSNKISRQATPEFPLLPQSLTHLLSDNCFCVL